MSRRRACQGTTRTGTPCTVPPLTATGAATLGLPEHDQPWCRAHHPDLPASARFGSRAQARAAGRQGGRPRVPRVVDILKERLEADADEWIRALKDALGAEMPYTVGYGEDAYVEFVPDHRTRLKAIEIALDRAYGRPRQQTEVSGPEGGPVQVEAPPDAAARSVRAVQLLQRLGQLPDDGDARDG